MNLEDAIKRPFQNVGTLLVGTIISIIPIINIITLGYFIECARRSFKNDNILPNFGDVVEKFITGLKVYLVQAIYSIPVLIVALILLFSLFGPIFTAAFNGDLAGVQTALSNMVFGLNEDFGSFDFKLLITVIFGFAVGLLSLAGVLRFAQTNSFESAFSFRDIKSVAFTVKFLTSLIISGFTAGVVGIVLGIPISMITGVLPNITVPFFGNIFQLIGGGFLSFTTGIIYWTVLANNYSSKFLTANMQKTDGGKRAGKRAF